MLHGSPFVRGRRSAEHWQTVNFPLPRFPHRLSLLLSALLLQLSAPVLLCGETVFEDSFAYSGWNSGNETMAARWEKVMGRDPEFITSSETLPAPYILLSNAIFFMPLEGALEGSFTISVEALFTVYSRSLWFGLLDGSGLSGRCAVWSSAKEDQFSGQGWVDIRKIDSFTPDNREAGANPNLFSSTLAENRSSGHEGGALAPPFARIDLSWDAEAKQWHLSVDGKLRLSAPDAFEPGVSPRLYFGGGTGTVFKNITVQKGATPQ